MQDTTNYINVKLAVALTALERIRYIKNDTSYDDKTKLQLISKAVDGAIKGD
jgi:hypothetical protein